MVRAFPLAALLSAGMAMAQTVAPAVPPSPDPSGFSAWLAGYRQQALARGANPAAVDAVLQGLDYSPRVVELDRAQPDDSGTRNLFSTYLAKRLDSGRISAGKAVADRMATPLAAIQARYGVPYPVVLGIWGMESSYGRVTGDFDVPRSLATLAYDGRRATLFRTELDAAVEIVARGLAPREALKGSWAGAMGEPQFLPSSFLKWGADGDGDGKADIWTNDADVAASIANYLAGNGWRAGLGWGFPVTVPDGFDRQRVRNLVRPASCVRVLEKHSRWIPAAEWRKLGFVPLGAAWPADDTLMTLVEPDGEGQGAYLTTGNYRALLAYNCSNFYALSVALLGDAIAR
jgi:lytic murein transglycosylase